jgi:RNA polymerase sigma-70 factor (ECF subfamily)
VPDAPPENQPREHQPRENQPPSAAAGEGELVARLRAGDADAFAQVVNAWSPALLRVARSHVSTAASAEEVVQDTWLAVVRGLDGFQGRSSLRTWVFRILVNTAKTRGVRESRAVPWSALDEDAGPTVDPARFRGDDDRWPRHWTVQGTPQPWEPAPEERVLSGEVRELLVAALDALPPRQRSVVSLHDVAGLSSGEVCDILGLTAANQRVLLHRGRARVRAALEEYYRETPKGVR